MMSSLNGLVSLNKILYKDQRLKCVIYILLSDVIKDVRESSYSI